MAAVIFPFAIDFTVGLLLLKTTSGRGRKRAPNRLGPEFAFVAEGGGEERLLFDGGASLDNMARHEASEGASSPG
jgi:hypothetical protein